MYGVAEVGAQRPRAGEGDFIARHGEAAIAANGCVGCCPAGEGVAFERGSLRDCYIFSCFVGCFIGECRCAGGNRTCVLIGDLIFRSRALYAGDVEVIDFTSCGEGSFLVCSIVAVLVKVSEIGVKGYCVGQLISISGLAAISSYRRITEFPFVTGGSLNEVIGLRGYGDMVAHGVKNRAGFYALGDR